MEEDIVDKSDKKMGLFVVTGRVDGGSNIVDQEQHLSAEMAIKSFARKLFFETDHDVICRFHIDQVVDHRGAEAVTLVGDTYEVEFGWLCAIRSIDFLDVEIDENGIKIFDCESSAQELINAENNKGSVMRSIDALEVMRIDRGDWLDMIGTNWTTIARERRV
jgi:hypothetical protein